MNKTSKAAQKSVLNSESNGTQVASADPAVFQARLLTLVKTAKDSGGTISQSEIDAFASELSLDDEKLDELSSFLEQQGIEVFTENDDDVTTLDNDDDDLDDEDDASKGDLELIEEEEASSKEIEDTSADYVNIEDPVRMYLKEIGSIRLLTADEEISIATRIEDGRIAESLEKRYIRNGETEVTDEMIMNVFLIPKDIEVPEEVHKAEVAKKCEIFRGFKKQDLSRLAADGNAAKKELSEANLRLVVSIAKKYIGHGMSFLDLIQEGNLGLLKAVDKFDYRKGFKFSTYATWWIRQSITRAISDQARTIRIPVHMVETINKYTRTRRQLTTELGREPKPDEVAAKMNISVDKVNEIIKISQEPVSLETPVGEEDDSSIGDFVPDDKEIAPEQAVTTRHLREQLDEVLATLTDREQKVLRLRYGLDDGKPRTLEEVGQEFGVTRERIRQIEAKAMRKLSRNPSKSKKLRDYLDD